MVKTIAKPYGLANESCVTFKYTDLDEKTKNVLENGRWRRTLAFEKFVGEKGNADEKTLQSNFDSL